MVQNIQFEYILGKVLPTELYLNISYVTQSRATDQLEAKNRTVYVT